MLSICYARCAAVVIATLASVPAIQAQTAPGFDIREATISDIQGAILEGQITATDVVERYLERISAFNGTCVEEPEGILGAVTPIADADGINALMTLNLRPATREAWGFDARKARSLTDIADDDPDMPDAFEVAAALDAAFAETGELVGPLHGVVFSIKDMIDTYDMRTTSGADADFANDRPPADSVLVERLREAGAIILAKANLGEYASGSRSAFGGTMCNPYDTTRDVGGSSGGSASSVAANLVTCAISEEGGPSIRMPSRVNNIVGLSGTQGLVPIDNMLGGGGLNDRNGPTCRTVLDTALVLDTIAGWSPQDEITSYSVGRIPENGYASFATEASLEGLRIGVVREYMDKELFTVADHASIDAIEAAIEDLRAIGADIVDPGPGGDLFTGCVRQYLPRNLTGGFIEAHPELFPEGGDHVGTLLAMHFDPGLVPEDGPTLRDFGVQHSTEGERRYFFERYLAERGDAAIGTLAELLAASRFYADEAGRDTRFRNVDETLSGALDDSQIDLRLRNAHRAGIQQTVMHCMMVLDLDALTYPTGNIPPTLIKGVVEPTVHGRSHQAWNVLGQMGFPAMTVPAGFISEAWDRVRDPAAPDGNRLEGPNEVNLPVGIDFVAMPFNEPILFRIASAYEAATGHRAPPERFDELPVASTD